MFYFDTSFVAPLVLAEDTSKKVEDFICSLHNKNLAVSHWTCVEFASLIARLVRMKQLNRNQANDILDVFKQLINDSYIVLMPTVVDFECAVQLLRHFTGLRSGDALHLAIVKNHNAKMFYTLDKDLIKIAKSLKISASAGI